MSFSTYNVHHFDLSTGVQPVRPAASRAHYCVFWYKSIPLGEAWFRPCEPASDDAFWRRCFDAVLPAVKHYASGRVFFEEEHSFSDVGAEMIGELCRHVLEHVQPRNSVELPDVSVVICTRDRARDLARCLESFRHQHLQPSEIIVVDNASLSDDTRRVAEQFDTRYVREDVPGLDIARNRGVRAARSQVVAFTDDDARPDPWWVYRVAETFRNPSVAAMTGLVIAESLDTEAEVIFEKYWPFNRGYRSKVFDEAFFRSTLAGGPPVWEIGAGANMAFRRKTFARAGYFDPRLDAGAAGCSGDSELWYRVLAAGMTIVYNPLAVVHHRHRRSMEELRRQLYSYMRGFTVAILIQHQRFRHRGNLRHLFGVLPAYYLSLIRKGFPRYAFQYQTLFHEVRGILSGLLYYALHRNTESKSF